MPRSPGKLTLSTTLKMVRKNKPLLVLCLGALFLLGGSFTMNAVMLYYARDVLGSASSFTWLYLAQTIGTIGIASQVPAITRKFGKRIGYVSLAFIAVVGFVLIAVVPAGGGGLLLALVAFLIYGVGFGGTNALMFSMQADTVDYGEWKTGTRAEGGSYSILSFVRKCGQGLGGFAGWGGHRCLRVRRGGAAPVGRGNRRHQGRGRMGPGRAVRHRRAGALALPARG